MKAINTGLEYSLGKLALFVGVFGFKRCSNHTMVCVEVQSVYYVIFEFAAHDGKIMFKKIYH